jgi:hypothetical protein
MRPAEGHAMTKQNGLVGTCPEIAVNAISFVAKSPMRSSTDSG